MKSGQSTETAIAGTYEFNIRDIFREAAIKTNGLKGRFWKALLLILVITIVATMVSFSVSNAFSSPTSFDDMAEHPQPIAQLLQMIFSIFLITPLFAGLLVMCIKHCSGTFVPFNTVFQYVSYWRRLWIYPVAMTVIALINAYTQVPIIHLCVDLVMVFIIVTYFMFIPLVAEKNLDMWTALETSRKAIFHHWFKTLWFIILMGIVMVISTLALLIPLIWTLPWAYNSMAILYRNMFGVRQE